MLRAVRPNDAGAVAALIRTALAAQPVVPDPPMFALRMTAEDAGVHLPRDRGARNESPSRKRGRGKSSHAAAGGKRDAARTGAWARMPATLPAGLSGRRAASSETMLRARRR